MFDLLSYSGLGAAASNKVPIINQTPSNAIMSGSFVLCVISVEHSLHMLLVIKSVIPIDTMLTNVLLASRSSTPSRAGLAAVPAVYFLRRALGSPFIVLL